MALVKVKVKVGPISYKSKAYKGGETFDIDEGDVKKFFGAVVIVNKSNFRKPTTKQVTKSITKSKKKK